jgi:hypothetical protein
MQQRRVNNKVVNTTAYSYSDLGNDTCSFLPFLLCDTKFKRGRVSIFGRHPLRIFSAYIEAWSWPMYLEDEAKTLD